AWLFHGVGVRRSVEIATAERRLKTVCVIALDLFQLPLVSALQNVRSPESRVGGGRETDPFCKTPLPQVEGARH
ncbi:hypothetical protein NPIL_594971, partial [Nephila pilipes]